jgi:hypothetical protein
MPGTINSNDLKPYHKDGDSTSQTPALTGDTTPAPDGQLSVPHPSVDAFSDLEKATTTVNDDGLKVPEILDEEGHDNPTLRLQKACACPEGCRGHLIALLADN